jgi:hypothetical protein
MRSFMAFASSLALSAGAVALVAASQSPAPDAKAKLPENPPEKAAEKPGAQVAVQLVEAFAKQGIHLDLERKLVSIPAVVDIRGDLLEYLLVNPRGAAHESTFVTNVVPSQLNTALLALGVKPGKNAAWVRKDPPPTPDEIKNGVPAYEVKPPEGDGFFLYAAWKSDGETYLYRVEDLLLDLSTGASMRRHRWVYLGSRLVRLREDAGQKTGQEVFAADVEGNLVNIALFEQGNTLLTGADPHCLSQTIWQTNSWLVPQQGAQVEFIFARERLATLPPDLEAKLPAVTAESAPPDEH